MHIKYTFSSFRSNSTWPLLGPRFSYTSINMSIQTVMSTYGYLEVLRAHNGERKVLKFYNIICGNRLERVLFLQNLIRKKNLVLKRPTICE
jgi:hypothetical protein